VRIIGYGQRVKIIPEELSARKIFLVTGTLILVGCSFTVAALAGESAKQCALLQLTQWGGGYGGTQNNSGSGYGGQQGGQQGGGWSGQQQQTPQGGYGGQQQNQGGYNGGQQQNEGGYNSQPQGDYQGQQQEGGNSGQQQQGGTGGQRPSGGPQQTGNGGDKTACVADCNKQCLNDFVPGSTKQKNCSDRCGRICR
jgi:hypothetical protein